jgi:glycosyl transferase family 25
MFEEITKVIYINLEERQDRKEKVESELKKYFPSDKIQRFNAIKHQKGYIGCTKSHIAVLELAIQQNWKNVLVVEDDAIWSNFEKGYPVYKNLIKNQFDVITFGITYASYDNSTYKLLSGQTTTSYLVKNHYYKTLLDNFKYGLEQLLINRRNFFKNTKILNTYTIDQYWKILQAKDKWFCVVPSLFVQSPSYSDIEKRNVNYIDAFL